MVTSEKGRVKSGPLADDFNSANADQATLVAKTGLVFNDCDPAQSMTVTEKLRVAVIPAASLAVPAEVVVPTRLNKQEAGARLTVTPGHLSATFGAGYVITTSH